MFESPNDGWVLKPNESFVKEWRFANSGDCTWTDSYRLVLTDGTNLADMGIYNLIDVSDMGDTWGSQRHPVDHPDELPGA